MSKRDRGPVLRGYIVGNGKNWHAICLDLDIAADGGTPKEARLVLEGMVIDYLNEVRTLSADQQKKLLNRKAPFLTRLGYHFAYFVASFFNNRSDDRFGFILHGDSFGALSRI